VVVVAVVAVVAAVAAAVAVAVAMVMPVAVVEGMKKIFKVRICTWEKKEHQLQKLLLCKMLQM
jgi:hypothetical protein